MAYVECPECGLRLNTAVGFAAESCPRCLARHRRRVWLESKIGPLTSKRFERARRLADVELREAGLTPEPPQP